MSIITKVRTRGAFLSLLGAGFLVGCASSDLTTSQALYREGRVDEAAVVIEQYSEKHNGDSAQMVIAWIERGSILRTAGRYSESDEAFALVESRIEDFETRADTDVGEEIGALLTTPDKITYRGFDYDRVFVAVYRGLNSLAMEDYETPRQHFVRASQWQDFTVERNRRLIERAQDEKAEAQEKCDVDRTLQSDDLQAAMRDRYGNLELFSGYENFANPFADFVRAVFLLGVRQSYDDIDTARNLMRRVAGMVDANPYVLADLDRADRAARGEGIDLNMTYVFFETGVAPHREEFRITLPLFLVNGYVDTVSIAVPYLEFNGGHAGTLRIDTGDGTHHTVLLADVDRIIAGEFKQRLPTLITRMVASAVVKSALQYAMNEATKSNEWVNLFSRIGMAVYAAGTNRADLRTWATLPKEIQYASFPTPPDASLAVYKGGFSSSVTLEQQGLNIVVVRSINAQTPPKITSHVIRPNGSSY